MRYLILIIATLFIFSCKEKESQNKIVLEEVQIQKPVNDSTFVIKNEGVYETIPNPKVILDFVSTEDSLIHY